MTTPHRIETQKQEDAPLPTVITQTTSTHRSASPNHPTSISHPRQELGNDTNSKHTEASRRARCAIYNRIRVLMIHAPRYSFQGQARLAADTGVSRSTISRLLSGRINPSFRLAQAVTAALEKHLERPLDPREILSPDGTYPTPSGCALAGCRGCMPEDAFDKDGCMRPDFCDLRPGDWSLSRPSEPHTFHNLSNQGKETK